MTSRKPKSGVLSVAEKIVDLEKQNALLRHQVTELKARVRGESRNARRGWDAAFERDNAIAVIAEVMTSKLRTAEFRNPDIDAIPF
ncbi:hypothetical protein [Mesorhizobium sp. CAU 1732]|uniref:hypothetical protein n=1 Tax=Mesorhizobium sp. CAU 1732 TaxID=3140358 RepID=UPI00326133E9